LFVNELSKNAKEMEMIHDCGNFIEYGDNGIILDASLRKEHKLVKIEF
jgi:hypothetical protein